MKKIIAKIVVLLSMIMPITDLSAEEKPVETNGRWTEDRTRSLVPQPARPIVYIFSFRCNARP